MHSSPQHLSANTKAFIPECYRIIRCVKQPWKFWFNCFSSGLITSIGLILYEMYYKNWLIFYFRNDEMMINQTHVLFVVYTEFVYNNDLIFCRDFCILKELEW